MSKRYYWMKLKEDFFDDDAIEWLEEQPKGKEYSLFYLKLCLKSLKTNGILIRNVGTIMVPYDIKKLAEITKTDFDTVVVAMELLKKIGLIELHESGEICIPRMKEMIGSESEKASLMRKSREQKRLLDGNNVTTMLPECSHNVTQSIENRDRDKEIEKEKYFCPELKNSGLQLEAEKELTVVLETEMEKDLSQDSGKRVEIEPCQRVFISLPLLDKTNYSVTESYVQEMKQLYPAIDVEQEMRNMKGWLDANPNNRKTPRGIKRFMNGWLARAQDRAPKEKTKQSQKQSQNKFNNFHQRQYDFDELEKQLLT